MPKIEPFQKHAIKYDRWFEENKYAYQSEINAIKSLLQELNNAVENPVVEESSKNNDDSVVM